LTARRRRSGEVVEDVPPPLPLATPLLLVKPAAGLSTPAVFRALDLAGRSGADPRRLLAALAAGGAGGSLPAAPGHGVGCL
jgi:4-diphosphocytidyl-2-C-methyl-D-erythritol kinase